MDDFTVVSELREQVMIMVNMAACKVGGLTQEQADRWWDEISNGILNGFEGTITDLEEFDD